MTVLQERKRRGEELLKRYRTGGVDLYCAASDAIADILLFVAQSEGEGTQLLHSAEMDFRDTSEGESFVTEG